ncbi:MAG: efflux RND transporter periplasmic adaptor subunit [Desulfovibrio sp.]
MRTTIFTYAAICLAMFTAGCGNSVEADTAPVIKPVRAITISDTTTSSQRTFPGKVKASQQVALAFRVAGQINELNINEGDEVTKGQILCRLDNSDYLTSVRNLESKLRGSHAVLKEAKLDLKRKKQLISSDTIAQASLDASQSSYESALAAVNSLQQDLKQSKLQLKYTTLKAPFSGTIAVKHVDNYQYIQAKEAVVELEDVSALDVVVDIPEHLWASKMTQANNITSFATFATYPDQSFPLKFKESETRANAQTQTYSVTLTMPTPQGFAIRPGMTATVHVNYNTEKTDKVQVPVSAVFSDSQGDKIYIWLIDDKNRVQKKAVKTGMMNGSTIEILSTLPANPTIVSTGVHFLTDNQEIRILKGKIGGRN